MGEVKYQRSGGAIASKPMAHCKRSQSWRSSGTLYLRLSEGVICGSRTVDEMVGAGARKKRNEPDEISLQRLIHS